LMGECANIGPALTVADAFGGITRLTQTGQVQNLEAPS
jgi:hypothetical protein